VSVNRCLRRGGQTMEKKEGGETWKIEQGGDGWKKVKQGCRPRAEVSERKEGELRSDVDQGRGLGTRGKNPYTQKKDTASLLCVSWRGKCEGR